MVDIAPERFADHFIPSRAKFRAALPASTHVEVSWTSTLDADVAKWKKKGYAQVGQADVRARASSRGPVDELADLARTVGADAVLFCTWPAKLRSARRTPSGEIDLWALVNDPPASFSPKSYSVTRAIFMAQK